jgi:hypothetical protein
MLQTASMLLTYSKQPSSVAVESAERIPRTSASKCSERTTLAASQGHDLLLFNRMVVVVEPQSLISQILEDLEIAQDGVGGVSMGRPQP